MTHKGKVCEGDITSEIKEATKLQRLSEMLQSTKPHIKQVAQAVTLSAPSIRKYIANKKDITTRYMTRALSDSLPTYKNEAKKIQTGNTYEAMYGDKIEGGMCVLCGDSKVEDNHHIFCECQKYAHIRKQAMDTIEEIWGEDIRTRNEWGMIDYLTQKSVEGWQQWWGWLGLVPQKIHAPGGRGTKKRLKQTAAALGEAGYKMWIARNEAIQVWEEEKGIKERKTEIRTKHITFSTNKRERRGRPEKPDEELSPGYRKVKHNKQLLQVLRQQGYTTAEARQEIRIKNKQEATQEVADTHYRNISIQRWTGQTTKQGFHPKPKAKNSIKPPGITERKYVHSLGRKHKIPKRLKLLDKVQLSKDEMEAYRLARQNGKCAFGACGNPATTVAELCINEDKDPRCEEHKYFLCRGTKGTRECRCAINAEMADIRESGTANRRRNPTSRQTGEERKDKAKQHRSYTVDIGDTVQLEDCDEGIIQGVVRHMVWINHGGFRVPDAMEIEWMAEEGTTETAEIKMNDRWRVTKRRREETEESTETAEVTEHMRFSSQEFTSETAAADIQYTRVKTTHW